ncbi:DUF6397 family protein [Microbacterium dauci]|uniref:Helix-turn-helix domain-containing protein n=1 Tax=Microbacterium dauci TaxID=3048008 RepID=A0ABT6ZGP4_9MICO|nr:helix-turn-helix domain-containing protein [Microbacterium sp. LX3-4]MDJ1115330.1 helix-turn-helix domain-containing protein [Microbacterium sp. LX3-4]
MSLVTQPNLIGSAEAARLLHVDRSTLTRWVKAGRIEPVQRLDRYRGDFLFDAADVAAMAATE